MLRDILAEQWWQHSYVKSAIIRHFHLVALDLNIFMVLNYIYNPNISYCNNYTAMIRYLD